MKLFFRSLIVIPVFVILFSACDVLEEVLDEAVGPNFTEEEASEALKDALKEGTDRVTDDLSMEDGYLEDPNIKIPMPDELQEIENTLRDNGLDRIADHLEVSMNRVAENAADEAYSVFFNAIYNMSITDAIDIATGADNAATQYLKETTYSTLEDRYSGVVSREMEALGVFNSFDRVVERYNDLPMVEEKDVELDMGGYVTEKALEGLFYYVEEKEKEIRRNPAERPSEVAQKVFGEVYGS